MSSLRAELHLTYLIDEINHRFGAVFWPVVIFLSLLVIWEVAVPVFEEIDFLEPTKSTDEYYTNQFIEDNQERALEVANLYHDTLTESDGVGPDYV